MTNASVDKSTTGFAPRQPEKMCRGGFWSFFEDDQDCDAAKNIFHAKLVTDRANEFYTELTGGSPERFSVGSECDSRGCGDIQGGIAGFLASRSLNLVIDIGSDTGDINNSTSAASPESATRIDGRLDPYSTITGMGHGIIRSGHYLYMGVLGVVAIKSVLEGTSKALTGKTAGFLALPPIQMITSTLSSIVNWLMMIIVAAYGAGIMLAYVIPMLPVIRWIMAMVGWVLMVIEAMAAMPLHAVMAAMPEGEGISGSRQERGYGIILALILSPPLLIVGLIASLTIMNVGFLILNSIFWPAVTNIMPVGVDIFAFFIALYLYVMTVLILTRIAFRTIDGLRNNVLEWLVAGGMNRAFGEDETVNEQLGGLRTQTSNITQSIGGGFAGGAKRSMDDAVVSEKKSEPSAHNPPENEQSLDSSRNSSSGFGGDDDDKRSRR